MTDNTDATYSEVSLVQRRSRPERPEGLHRAKAAVIDLIRPPMIVPKQSLSVHGPTPPIGLAYIASALRSDGHDVAVIDAQGMAVDVYTPLDSPIGTVFRVGLTIDQICSVVRPQAQIIGLSLMFFQEWPTVRELLARLRADHPTASFILGGETATAFARWIFEQSPNVDYIVKGEGEATVSALVDALMEGTAEALRRVIDMPGVAARSTELDAPGGISDGGLPTRIRDLATIQRPAWDLFPLENYWKNPYFGVDRGRSMPMLATRGCPYSCSFCSAPQMWTNRFTVRDPDDLADEIASYVELHGVSNINFVDLTPITKRSWTLAFCDALDRKGLKISWQLPIGTRSEILDREVLTRLRDTGCTNIAYAPESGSPRMVEIFQKRVDLEHLLTSATTANSLGITTHFSIIIGHPQERWRDRLISTKYLLRGAAAGVSDAAVILFCPYPGSADFDRLVESGTLRLDDAACFHGLGRASSAAVSFNPNAGPRMLQLTQLLMLATFYAAAFLRHPGRIVQFVKSVRNGEEETYLDQMVRSQRMAKKSRSAGVRTDSADASPTSGAHRLLSRWKRRTA